MMGRPVRERGFFARNYNKIQKSLYLFLILAVIVAAVMTLYSVLHEPVKISNFSRPDSVEQVPMVNVTVEGAVESPVTIELPKGSTVFDALVKAHLKQNADLTDLVLEQKFMDKENKLYVNEIVSETTPEDSKPFLLPSLESEAETGSTVGDNGSSEQQESPDISKLNVVNILYVGAPHVYIFASIAPSTGRGSLLIIPPITRVFLPDKSGVDQLQQLYVMGGTKFLIDYVQNILRLPVHYFIEDSQESFIKTIDLLGGFRVKLDDEMAEVLGKKPGYQTLDGMESYRFIQYVEPTGSVDVLRTSMTTRMLRWKRFVDSAYFNFKGMDWRQTILLARHITMNLNTNMKLQDILFLARSAKEHNGFKLDFNFLQGSPRTVGKKVYWEVDDSNARLEGVRLIESVIK